MRLTFRTFVGAICLSSWRVPRIVAIMSDHGAVNRRKFGAAATAAVASLSGAATPANGFWVGRG